ncbi:MAG: twin-arginine translocase subunit TatB [Rhodocyclaceae bacterium]|nr:MAG: twin-arginine translocase subunit TatB [Rhodocyclaceae bacterium]
MFDVGFSELVVIAVVALVVIGPERLPSVARTVGAMLGRAQRYFNNIKSEVNRELQLEELKRIQQETYERVMAMEAEVHGGLAQVENKIHEAVAPVAETEVTPVIASVASTEPTPTLPETDPGQGNLFSSPPEHPVRPSPQRESQS